MEVIVKHFLQSDNHTDTSQIPPVCLLTQWKKAEFSSCCATQETQCPGLPAAPQTCSHTRYGMGCTFDNSHLQQRQLLAAGGQHYNTACPRSYQPTEACRDDTWLTPTPSHLCNNQAIHLLLLLSKLTSSFWILKKAGIESTYQGRQAGN